VTLVSAVMGTPSEAERDAATLELLEYGMSLYGKRTAVERDERLGEVAITDRDVTVPVIAADPVELTVRADEDVEVEAKGVPAEVKGPISKGDEIGAAIVTVDGEPEARVPLVAARSADAASLIERIDAALPGSRVGAWGLLALGALAVLLVVVPLVVWLWRRRSVR